MSGPLRNIIKAALGSALCVAGCDEGPTGSHVSPTVAIVVDSMSLSAGEAQEVELSYSNIAREAIGLSVGDTMVAVIRGGDTLVARRTGRSVLIASVRGTNIRDSAVVIVRPVIGDCLFSVYPTVVTLDVNQGIQLHVSQCQYGGATFRSSDTTRATVSATGWVTGRAPGTAIITAISARDTTWRSTATITVR